MTDWNCPACGECLDDSNKEVCANCGSNEEYVHVEQHSRTGFVRVWCSPDDHFEGDPWETAKQLGFAMREIGCLRRQLKRSEDRAKNLEEALWAMWTDEFGGDVYAGDRVVTDEITRRVLAKHKIEYGRRH